MVAPNKLYQSILHNLSVAPVSVLKQIDAFLQKFTLDKQVRQTTKQATLALAGAWSDMSDTDFEDE